MTEIIDPAAKRNRWLAVGQYAMVIAVATALMLFDLGGEPLEGHEAFVACTARNMTTPDAWLNPQTTEGVLPPNTTLNHWLIPVLNGRPRLVKTPLAYWCVAGLIKLDLPANDFTVRLPSAVMAVATVVLVLALGRSMFSGRTALMGALTLATSLGLAGWGRNARADMQMTFWMTMTMACAYWALRQPREGRPVPGFGKRSLLLLAAWGALGMANLAKQLAPMFVLLPIMLYLCWKSSVETGGKLGAEPADNSARRNFNRYLIMTAIGYVVGTLTRITPFLNWWKLAGLTDDKGIIVTLAITIGGPLLWYAFKCRLWRQWSVLLISIPGAALMLALFAPWMLYMMLSFPQASDIFNDQTAERALGTGGWLGRSASQLTGYYIWALAKWTAPWLVFIPGALAIPFLKRFRQDRDPLMFLLLWVFGLVLLFSISVGKHEQYIIPALPAACLLIGYCMDDVFFQHRWFSLKLAKSIVAGYGIAILAVALGAAITLAFINRDLRPYVVHMLVIADLTLAPLWLALAFLRKKPAVCVALMVLAVVAAEMGYAACDNPWRQRADVYAQIGDVIRKEVPPGDKLVSIGVLQQNVIWYSGRDLPEAARIKSHLEKQFGPGAGEELWRGGDHETPADWIIVFKQLERAAVKEEVPTGYVEVSNIASFGVQPVRLLRRQTGPVTQPTTLP